MEQSVSVLNSLVLESPLSVEECRARLKNHTVRFLPWGVWLQSVNVGGGPELNGRIGPRRIRLIRPHVMNSSHPELVGTLDAGEDGGTILKARIRYTFGWPRSGTRNDDDLDYLIDALARISQFTKVGGS
jgi:hypothetical protein